MSKHYEQRKEANARWAAKKERFYMYLDPEDKEDFAAYAKAKGESLTGFLVRCAKAEMTRNPLPASFDETCRQEDNDIDLDEPFEGLEEPDVTAVRYERYATAEQITQRAENK